MEDNKKNDQSNSNKHTISWFVRGIGRHWIHELVSAIAGSLIAWFLFSNDLNNAVYLRVGDQIPALFDDSLILDKIQSHVVMCSFNKGTETLSLNIGQSGQIAGYFIMLYECDQTRQFAVASIVKLNFLTRFKGFLVRLWRD